MFEEKMEPGGRQEGRRGGGQEGRRGGGPERGWEEGRREREIYIFKSFFYYFSLRAAVVLNQQGPILLAAVARCSRMEHHELWAAGARLPISLIISTS